VESVNDIAGLYTAYRAQIQLKSSNVISSIASRTRSIGAICESSRYLAQRMHGAMTHDGVGPIVELGAGFGSVTQLLPESAISIEREKERYDYLRESFPDRAILDCCAIAFLPSLEAPAVIFSSIPSVNNPEFARLRTAVAHNRQRGLVAELITYTYFPTNNPFAGIFSVEERAGVELRNLPPAFVWRYKC
jgi:phospholipid N-methyltransferase